MFCRTETDNGIIQHHFCCPSVFKKTQTRFVSLFFYSWIKEFALPEAATLFSHPPESYDANLFHFVLHTSSLKGLILHSDQVRSGQHCSREQRQRLQIICTNITHLLSFSPSNCRSLSLFSFLPSLLLLLFQLSSFRFLSSLGSASH